MARRHSRAEVVAQRLAGEFLERGNFVFAGRMGSHLVADILPAGVQREPIDGGFEDIGFADLAVQSVGFEEGVDNPKVHVYVTKGPRRKEAELEDEQVTVQINRIGKVVVRPEVASAAAARGQVFLRNSRIACGSSCAPSGENYAGTLGALVRKKGDKDLFVLSNNHVLAAANHTPVGMPILSPARWMQGPAELPPPRLDAMRTFANFGVAYPRSYRPSTKT